MNRWKANRFDQPSVGVRLVVGSRRHDEGNDSSTFGLKISRGLALSRTLSRAKSRSGCAPTGVAGAR